MYLIAISAPILPISISSITVSLSILIYLFLTTTLLLPFQRWENWGKGKFGLCQGHTAGEWWRLDASLETMIHYALGPPHINMEIQERWPALDTVHAFYNLILITRLSTFLQLRKLRFSKGKFILKSKIVRKGGDSEPISLCLPSFRTWCKEQWPCGQKWCEKVGKQNQGVSASGGKKEAHACRSRQYRVGWYLTGENWDSRTGDKRDAAGPSELHFLQGSGVPICPVLSPCVVLDFYLNTGRQGGDASQAVCLRWPSHRGPCSRTIQIRGNPLYE